jgi:hypothetical protein
LLVTRLDLLSNLGWEASAKSGKLSTGDGSPAEKSASAVHELLVTAQSPNGLAG